jgi:hypothetical protein
MSALRRSALQRWAAVLAGAVLIVASPSIASGVSSALSREPAAAPAELLQRALRSATVPHVGLAESRGSLGLPDVRRFGDVAALLGSTTRARVWWASTGSWRVARLLPSGEQDLYAAGDNLTVSWDYERNRQRTTVGEDAVRLPRVDDLLPPQAVRRLLGALGPDDRVTAASMRRVAGRDAAGLRVVPSGGSGGSPDATVGAVDVWVDPGSGLPLAVAVRDRAGGTAFESTFLAVDLRAPAAADVAVPTPEGARIEVGDAPDLVALVDRYARGGFPDALAGRPRVADLVGSPSVQEQGRDQGGTATYGSGLARFIVVPLPPGPAGDVLDAVRLRTSVDDVPGGRLAVLASGIVTAAVAVRDGGQGSYLLAGLVSRELLTAAAKDLLTNPEAVAVP